MCSSHTINENLSVAMRINETNNFLLVVAAEMLHIASLLGVQGCNWEVSSPPPLRRRRCAAAPSEDGGSNAHCKFCIPKLKLFIQRHHCSKLLVATGCVFSLFLWHGNCLLVVLLVRIVSRKNTVGSLTFRCRWDFRPEGRETFNWTSCWQTNFVKISLFLLTCQCCRDSFSVCEVLFHPISSFFFSFDLNCDFTFPLSSILLWWRTGWEACLSLIQTNLQAQGCDACNVL